MIVHKLQDLLSIKLENINVTELANKIPLRYMPSYFLFISTNEEEEKKARKIFNEYNKYLVHSAQDDSKYQIEEDDQCIGCLITET